MKKQITILITVLFLTLCSCDSITDFKNSTNDDAATSTSDLTPNTSSGNVDGSGTGTTLDDVVSNEPPSYIYPEKFDSLAELKSSLSKKNEEAFYAKYADMGLPRTQLDALTSFVTKLQSQKICIPYIDGKEITLRNREGLSNISLYVSERYDLPWIYFHPQVSNGENYFIKVTYLPDDILTASKNPVASEVIKILSPNSANIGNLGTQHEKIYNQKIQLKDCEVTALVCEYKNDSRNSTIFVYEDLLVEIRSNPTVWDSQWFSTLSFGTIEE